MLNAFETFYDTFGIHKKSSTAYHPMTNGACKKLNNINTTMLALYASTDQKTTLAT